MKYLITTQETFVYEYLLEADSQEEAKEKFESEDYNKMIFRVDEGEEDRGEEYVADIREADGRDLAKWGLYEKPTL